MSGRRSNGEGTIYKRKDGRYEGATYVQTASGRRKRIRVYAKTRADAHEKLIAVQQQQHQGVPIADRSWILADYIDYWLENVAQSTRRESTRQSYVWVVERFIKPSLGSYRLEKLTVAIVQRWLDRLYAEGASRHRIRLLRTVLSTILTRAQREELVQRNVARLVELPRYKAKERVPWTLDEAKRFLAAVAKDESRPLYLLLIMYGLRRGELLGLRWGDVDFARGVIYIRNQLQRLGGKFVQGPVKTDAGNRDLPMLANVRQVLLDLRATPLTVQRDLSDEALVFVNAFGTPRDPDGFSKSFQRAAKGHGLRPIRVHDVRHTAATLLKDLGVPARDAQIILGHADIATTQQIYQHSTLETSEAALLKVEAAIRPSEYRVCDVAEVLGRCRQNGARSRQYEVSIGLFGVLLTSVNNGTREGIRTPDLWYRKSDKTSLRESVTRVERVLKAYRSQWIIGAVAVTVAVTTDLSERRNRIKQRLASSVIGEMGSVARGLAFAVNPLPPNSSLSSDGSVPVPGLNSALIKGVEYDSRS